LLRAVREEARAYLDGRVGEADLASMLVRHYGDRPGAAQGLAYAVQAAAPALPAGAATTDARDEVLIYREYPAVPLAAVPQLGPAWAAAYRDAPDTQQATPHTRTD